MRILLSLLLGLVVGAAGFHAYYLKLPAADRCSWDHPLSPVARDDCRRAVTVAGYGAAGRAALDKLIEKVGE